MLILFSILVVCIGIGIAVMHYGAGPERVVLQILLAATLLDFAYHGIIGPAHYRDVDIGHFSLDSATFIGLMWVGLRANRVWPLWVCAFQLQPLAVHLAMILRLPSNPMAYWVMMAFPSDLEVIALGLGTLAHVYRKRRIGPYRDWRLT